MEVIRIKSDCSWVKQRHITGIYLKCNYFNDFKIYYTLDKNNDNTTVDQLHASQKLTLPFYEDSEEIIQTSC